MIKLKVGIIGCGAVTQKNYVPNLPRIGKVKIRYLYDSNFEMAKKVSEISQAEVVTLNELKKNSDIIIIATPPSTHFQLLNEVLREGKIVICEKPFLTCENEVNEILSLSVEFKSQLFVGHFRRCFPTLRLAHDLLKTKILGKLKKITVYEGGKFSWNTESGYVFKEKSGGVLFDTGSHSIDMALFVTGLDVVSLDEIQILDIQRDKSEPSHEIKAKLKLNIDNKNSVELNFMLSRYRILSNKIKLDYENGFIEIPIEMKNYIKIGKENESSILYTKDKYEDLMDCFTMQFKDILDEVTGDLFKAYRFKNLIKILEVVRDFS